MYSGVQSARDEFRRHHLGEHEGGSDAGLVGPFGGPTAIEHPVPQAEGDDVGQPDRAAGGEQDRAGLLLVVADDGADEFDDRGEVVEAHRRDEHQRQAMQERRATIDAARVADHQHDQQQQLDRREEERRLQHVPVGERELHRRRHEHRHRHRPAALTSRERSYRRCRDRRAPSPAVRDQPPVEPAQNATMRSTNRSGSTRWG